LDDFGFNDLGAQSNVYSPVMDGLLQDGCCCHGMLSCSSQPFCLMYSLTYDVTPTSPIIPGIELTNYYVECVCSPTRATFLTGRFPLHHGVVDYIGQATPTGLPLNEVTIAQKLEAEHNYACHAIGKWHVGFYREEYTPTFRGFDSFVGFYGGAEDHYSHQVTGAFDLRRDLEPECGDGCSQVASDLNGTYSTSIFAARAVEVVENHAAAHAAVLKAAAAAHAVATHTTHSNTTTTTTTHTASDVEQPQVPQVSTVMTTVTMQPLFLYLCFQAVHEPLQAPMVYQNMNSGVTYDVRRAFAGMVRRGFVVGMVMKGSLLLLLALYLSYLFIFVR